MNRGTDATDSRRRSWFPSIFALLGWIVLASWAYLVWFILFVNVGRRKPIPDILLLVYYCSTILGFCGGVLWLLFAIGFITHRRLGAGTKTECAQLLALLSLTAVYVLAFLLED
jgi:hypothetical protein